MNKVFHFDIARENYQCDAAVVWCYDHRFDAGFRKFLKKLGVHHSDSIQVAGGAKCIASPARESDREFIFDQIRASMRLHATRRVILMVHSDCGGYGGLAAFKNDPETEAAHHQEELRRAATLLAQAIPGLEIQTCFVNFEGVWEPEDASELHERRRA